jgi:hypothetical protein
LSLLKEKKKDNYHPFYSSIQEKKEEDEDKLKETDYDNLIKLSAQNIKFLCNYLVSPPVILLF